MMPRPKFAEQLLLRLNAAKILYFVLPHSRHTDPLGGGGSGCLPFNFSVLSEAAQNRDKVRAISRAQAGADLWHRSPLFV